ncbi:MAG TPA: PDZ domain-containing protein [Dehalococcoidia bacterium]|nr:PDZ domain-containing protein [Dehalococcoidia bacterium]
MAKEFLSQKGVSYVERDVSLDRQAALELYQLTGRGAVPVIVVNNEVVVGFDRARLDLLLARAAQGKVSFGASVADASKILVKRGQIPIFGAFVGKVAPRSIAERAGLQPGDIITELNLRPIRNADDVEQALAGLEPGTRVRVAYLRGNQTLHDEVAV